MPIAEDDKIALCANLKFLRECLEAVRDKPEGWKVILSDAEGSASFIRKGLKKDATAWAQSQLIADAQITAKDWRDWWKKLPEKEERQFNSEIEGFLSVIDPLKAVVLSADQ